MSKRRDDNDRLRDGDLPHDPEEGAVPMNVKLVPSDHAKAAKDVTTVRNGAPKRYSLDGITPRAPEWLWFGRIPLGEVSSIDGMPSAGKSTVLSEIVACVTTGRPLYDDDRSREPAAALWIGHEEGVETAIVPRLVASEADRSRVFAYAGMPSFPSAYEWLRREIAETGAAIVVIDPIDAYLDFGANGDSHRNSDVRARLAELPRIAQEHRCAVVLVRHWRKGGGVDPMYRAAGSLAYTAVVRAQFGAAEDPDDASARLLTWSKVSAGPKPRTLRFAVQPVTVTGAGCEVIDTARAAWLGTDDRTANDIMGAVDRAAAGRGGGDERASAVDLAEAWLMGMLNEGGGRVRVARLKLEAHTEGHAWRTVERAKATRLKLRAEHVGGENGGGEWWWVAPSPRRRDDGKAANTAKQASLAVLAGGRASEAVNNPANTAPEAELGHPRQDRQTQDRHGQRRQPRTEPGGGS